MYSTITLSNKDFTRLSDFIHNNYGIKMPPVKKILLESRLQKRLKALNIDSFEHYCDYLFSSEGKEAELKFFIDKVTTNKTDFFREPEHFYHLTNSVIPKIIKSWKGVHNQLQVWSAGCSTGEEPYTIAMVIQDFADEHPTYRLNYSILATDISQEVLTTGYNAVYSEDKVEPVAYSMKKKYLLRSKEKNKRLVKMVPEIRNRIQFKMLNFMDSHYPLSKKVDIVFCRNVIIYFDKPTQESIINKLCKTIKPGGYFFQGHSESIQGFNVPLKPLYPTIYQKI
ncbi:MAG: chemotaxis protein CheR [Deltaproteobacteria bacterium]|jgi:chemotaxis protein methyltransferase CheR|nr:chemotaxis protein CheR [Deltaproteobacteria bacterium]MBT4527355.1 chemotaxis protein CheR [Deltaproteobacteria bacterium]